MKLLICFAQSIPNWAYDISALASIASLCISVYIAWSIRLVRHHYRQIALLPKIYTALQRHLKQFDQANSKKDVELLCQSFAQAKATIQEALDYTTGRARQSAFAALEKANRVGQSATIDFDTRSLNDFHMELLTLFEHLKFYSEHKKWR